MKNLRKRYRHATAQCIWEIIGENRSMCIDPGHTDWKVGNIYQDADFQGPWIEIPNKEYNFEILYQKLCALETQ